MKVKQSCLECATSGICQQVTGGRCTCCGTVAPATISPRAFYESKDQFIVRALEALKAFEAALLASAPVEVELTATAKATAKKVRCPHYEIIREFAALARENGLDMKAQDRARGAMGVYLGIKINSRAELSAGQWRNAITGLKAGILFW